MTRDEAVEKLTDLLKISQSCKYGYPMDFTDEHMLVEVIDHLRASPSAAPSEPKETK